MKAAVQAACYKNNFQIDFLWQWPSVLPLFVYLWQSFCKTSRKQAHSIVKGGIVQYGSCPPHKAAVYTEQESPPGGI